MEKQYQLEDGIITQHVSHKKNVIKLINQKDELILLETKKGEFAWSSWIDNDYYIIAYTIDKGDTIKICSAYNRREQRLIELNPTKEYLLEHMLLSKCYFDLTQVLSEINKLDLKLLMEDERDVLKKYLTLSNKQRTHQQEINYILSTYPSLKKYQDINKVLTVGEYRNIQNEVNINQFSFRIMPQEIEHTEVDIEEFDGIEDVKKGWYSSVLEHQQRRVLFNKK